MLKDYLIFRENKINNNSNELAGEYVIVFDLSFCQDENDNSEEVEKWISILHKHLKPSELASIISKSFDVPKKDVYNKLINK